MNSLLPNDNLDADLVARAQGGDRDAVDALIHRHQPWLLHIEHRMLWNRADAEDATQEILVKAITHLGEFQQRSAFRTWLYRIAANHLLDRCRSAKSFAAVARVLNEMPDANLPDPNSTRWRRAFSSRKQRSPARLASCSV
jgi:RNA polymerase sigma factor (sigma-70 family)